MRKLLLTLLCFTIFTSILAQDVQQVVKAKPFKANGGLTMSSSYYEAHGMTSRMDPHAWVINANLNLSLFGVVNAPFSATFTKDNQTYNQPSYNQIGISPKYKWLTVHGGYRSINFSSYSLSGITFLGGGVEAEPTINDKKNIKVSAFYGLLAKGVAYSPDYESYSDNGLFNVPGYKRIGYGTKLTFGKSKHIADVIFLKVEDDINSIPDPGVESGITPMENIVIGIATKNKITKTLSINIDYTMSALTTDIRNEKLQMDEYSYANNLGNLFIPRFSSTSSNAFTSGLAYSGKSFSGSVNYKRIDPEYRSLGTTYLSNDVEEYSLNLTKSLFENKVNLSGNIGQQRNNLSEDLMTTDKRFIGGMNFTWSITPKINLNINHSNFNNTTTPSIINLKDTLHYAQITDNTSGMLSYNFGKEKVKHNTSLNISKQTVNTLNETAITLEESGTQMFNSNFSYGINISTIGMSIATAVSYNEFLQMDTLVSTSLGPTLTLNKSLLKKKMRLTTAYSLQKMESSSTESLMQIIRFNVTYKVNKHHSLNFISSLVQRDQELQDSNKLTKELRAGITYSFTF